MSDKSKNGGGGKGRPPTRGGPPKSGAGKPPGARPFRSRDAAASERPSRKREGDNKPFRPRPDGNDRPNGDRAKSERPMRAGAGEGGGARPLRKREGGDKPFRPRAEGAERPYRARPEGDRAYRARPEGERPDDKRPARAGAGEGGGERPFRPRASGDKPFRSRPAGVRPPKSRDGDGGKARPYRARQGGDKPFRAKSEGERPPRRADAGDRPFRPRPEGDRPFRNRDGETRPGVGRERFARDGERPARPFQDGERGERPARDGAPFKRREDRSRPPPRPQFRPIPAEDEGLERVAKVIARAGLCSRRDAEAWVEAGRVAVNGELLHSPARDVGPTDTITVDGEPIPSRERTRLFLYHKPRGLVTTARDPEGRQTVFDSLPRGLPRLISVGRLDYNTEGLLILTNDGGLARMLELPETGWLRRYRVRAFGDVSQDRLDALQDGITIEGIHYGAIEARLDRRQGDNVWLTLGLREGKNREVKRICEHLGLDVNRLIRLSFGPFQLGELTEGAVEEVRTRVLMDQLGPELAAQAGVDFDAPVFTHEAEPEARAPQAQRFSKHVETPSEDTRPLRPKRRSRLEPVKSVWRADEDDAGLKRRSGVRREVDPSFARQDSATREHRRSGHVETRGGRKVLVEKLVADPAARERPAGERLDRQGRPRFEPAPAPDAEARVKRRSAPFAGHDGDAERPRRTTSDRPPRFEERAQRPARPPREPRLDDANREVRDTAARGAVPGGPKRSGTGGFAGKPGGRSGGKPGFGGKSSFGGKPGFGSKPGFGGGRPAGAGGGKRPGGPGGKGRPGGGRPPRAP
jgi:23S rRNA pseudouridine2605 synthase